MQFCSWPGRALSEHFRLNAFCTEPHPRRRGRTKPAETPDHVAADAALPDFSVCGAGVDTAAFRRHG
eukprot:scaffold2187_cov109-Isochrysis_galbana.AAC.3